MLHYFCVQLCSKVINKVVTSLYLLNKLSYEKSNNSAETVQINASDIVADIVSHILQACGHCAHKHNCRA